MATLQVVASTSVLTGGTVPISAAFLLGGMGWVEWFVYMAVPCYAIILVCGLAFLFWQKPGPVRRAAPERTELAGSRSPWTPAEIRTAIIITAMTALWLGDSFTGWDPLIPALLGSVALFTPGLGVITWKDFEGTSPWSIFFVTGTALSLAHALDTSGAASWLVNTLLGHIPLDHMPLIVVLIALMAVVVPVSIVLPNRAGVLGLVIPLLTSASQRIGVDPLPVGLMATIVCQISTFYPVQNAASLIAYQPRHFAVFDLMRAGLILFVVGGLLLGLVAVPWWALVGLPLRP
jgi:di/tricarboxylate transporter